MELFHLLNKYFQQLSCYISFFFFLFILEQCQLKSITEIQRPSYGTFTQCVKKEGTTKKDQICCGFLNFVYFFVFQVVCVTTFVAFGVFKLGPKVYEIFIYFFPFLNLNIGFKCSYFFIKHIFYILFQSSVELYFM